MNASRPAVLTPPFDPAGHRTRVRYKVLAIAVLLAGITYLDRVCIAITAPHMMRDLGLSKVQMSVVFSAFTMAYAIFEMPTGWWADRVGTRRVLTRIVVWWSTFTIMTGAAFNYSSLLAMRFLFGMGEAGAWPTVARTFSRWFPASERGTAQGIFFMGAHLAGGLTPLLVTAMLGVLNWRMLFVVFGSIGFLWAAAWYFWFRDEPADHSAVSRAELELIESGRAPDAGHRFGLAQFRRLLSNRTVLALCAMYFTQTYGFVFYVTWFPTYLSSQRGFSSFTLGILAGLPLTLSVLADLFGGITTDRLSRRFGLRFGRCVVGGGSLAFAGLFLIAGTFVADPVLAAILIAIAAASSNFLLGASWGTCIDIGGSHAGVLSAAMNTAGQVGGVLSPLVLGLVVEHFSNWNAPLYLTGALYLLGAVCWFWIDPQARLSQEKLIMAEDTLGSVEKLLASGDTSGALDCLIQSFAERKDFASLFEARRMKCRLELELPLIQIEDAAASAAEASPEYQKALIQAAREVGELALEAGDIPAAWRFFRAIGDPDPVAAAIERVKPGENMEEIIAIALQEGVHPVKGLDLVLQQHGMCRAITVFGMIPPSKGRTESITLLARNLHREVAEALARTIEAQEGSRPDTAGILPLIQGREWLFGEYDYYVDTSHLTSLLPYSIEAMDEGTLRLFHELCEYGKRLSSMFQFKGQYPFERPFVDYGEYVKAVLGDEEGINHFRRKVEAMSPDEEGTGAAQVLVSLLAQRKQYEEALDVSLAYLQDEDPTSLGCPSAVQLATLAGRYDRLQSNARKRGDVLGYVAATVMGGRK